MPIKLIWLSMWMGCLGHRWECNVYSHFFRQSVGISPVWTNQNSSHRGRIYHHGRPVDLFFFCKYSSNSLWSFSHSPASFQFCTTHTIVTNKVTLHELNLVLQLRWNQLVNRSSAAYLIKALRTGIFFVQVGKCPKIWAFNKQGGGSMVLRVVVLVKNSKKPPLAEADEIGSFLAVGCSPNKNKSLKLDFFLQSNS